MNRLYNLPDVVVITTQHRLTADDSDDAGVDITAYEGVLGFVLDATKRAGTNPTLAVKLQHSSDDGDDDAYDDVPGGAFTGLTGAAHLPEKLEIQKNALKKFVRTYRDIGGTDAPEYDVSVLMLAHKKYDTAA